MALVGCLMLVGCGGGDSEDSQSSNHYEATYEVSADGCNDNYVVSQFSRRLSDISVSAKWLSVTAMSYIGGTPSINIVAQPNTDKQSRSCTVIVKDADGNTLKLLVTQAAPTEKPSGDTTDEPTYNNTTSGNPAYAPIRR